MHTISIANYDRNRLKNFAFCRSVKRADFVNYLHFEIWKIAEVRVYVARKVEKGSARSRPGPLFFEKAVSTPAVG